MSKEKKELTEKEKQDRKDNILSWVFMLFFIVAFVVAFAFYGMQSTIFGG